MLHMKKHDSYDHPPNKPVSLAASLNATQKLNGGNSYQSAGLSPSKKNSPLYRAYWATKQMTLESGAISLDQYENMKETILTDMKTY